MVVALFVSSVIAILARLIAVYLLCLRHAARERSRWVNAQLMERIVLTARNSFVDKSWLAIDG